MARKMNGIADRRYDRRCVLTDEDRKRAVELRRQGWRVADIAVELGCSTTTVSNCWTRYYRTGNA
jgi:DNA-binding NarL/FixJ family response regulator